MSLRESILKTFILALDYHVAYMTLGIDSEKWTFRQSYDNKALRSLVYRLTCEKEERTKGTITMQG